MKNSVSEKPCMNGTVIESSIGNSCFFMQTAISESSFLKTAFGEHIR